MSIIADIASGEVDTADVFFLISVILAVIAAILSIPRPTAGRAAGYAAAAGWAALACAAFAWLVL